MKKHIVILLVLVLSLGNCMPSFAMEKNENTSDAEYLAWVEETDLSREDKEFLSENEHFQTRYKDLTDQGWVFTDVDVENVSITNDDNLVSTMSTSILTDGKIVTGTAVQPTVSKTYYNNKLYSAAIDIQKYVSVAAEYIPSEYAWIASTLFSIDSEDFATGFNNGYQKTEENATLHYKDAYYKVGDKYWIGYNVSKIVVAYSILSYFRDALQNPHQVTKTFHKSYRSPSYEAPNSTLILYAKQHYNTGWVMESITYPSTSIRLN